MVWSSCSGILSSWCSPACMNSMSSATSTHRNVRVLTEVLTEVFTEVFRIFFKLLGTWSSAYVTFSFFFFFYRALWNKIIFHVIIFMLWYYVQDCICYHSIIFRIFRIELCIRHLYDFEGMPNWRLYIFWGVFVDLRNLWYHISSSSSIFSQMHSDYKYF